MEVVIPCSRWRSVALKIARGPVSLASLIATGSPGVESPATIQFAELYQSVSQELGCGFFDAATVAKSTAEEDVHLDAANTRAIGMGLVPLVKELLDIG